MDAGLLNWASRVLHSKRKLSLSSFDDLKDGNLLLHLWELVAPEQTMNYVTGHVFDGEKAASQNISLLGAQLPSILRIPPSEIGEGSGSRILEVIACWQIGRIINFHWNVTDRKTLPSLIPNLSKAILNVVKQDLKGEYIPSLLSLLENDAKLLCSWMKVQCERVGETFPAPAELSGLEHCMRVAESKLSIPSFEIPTKSTIIPLMLFISLFYDHRSDDFEGSSAGICIETCNKVFSKIEERKRNCANNEICAMLSDTQLELLANCKDNAKMLSKQPKVKQAPSSEPESSNQQDSVESLTELADRLGEDKMRYITQIRDLMAMNQKKTKEIAELKKQITVVPVSPRCTSPVKSGSPKKDETTKEINEMKQKCALLDKENQELTEGIEMLYESESRLMQTNRELQSENEILSAMLEDVDSSQSDTSGSMMIAQLKEENESLKSSVLSLQNEAKKTSSYKDEISELNEMIIMLSSEVENMKTEENDSPKPQPTQRHSITPDEVWKQEMKKLQEEVNLLQEREKVRQRASTHLTKQDQSLHMRFETTKAELQQLQQDFKQKSIAYQRLEKENKTIEEKLKEVTAKLKSTIDSCGNDAPNDKDKPLPALSAIAERLSTLDEKYSLHSCSWRSLGLVLQAKMESDPAIRNILFAKAQWH